MAVGSAAGTNTAGALSVGSSLGAAAGVTRATGRDWRPVARGGNGGVGKGRGGTTPGAEATEAEAAAAVWAWEVGPAQGAD